ncbi:hypothetical protein ABTC30_19615, partial [Acinetobacter baumannii]
KALPRDGETVPGGSAINPIELCEFAVMERRELLDRLKSRLWVDQEHIIEMRAPADQVARPL